MGATDLAADDLRTAQVVLCMAATLHRSFAMKIEFLQRILTDRLEQPEAYVRFRASAGESDQALFDQ